MTETVESGGCSPHDPKICYRRRRAKIFPTKFAGSYLAPAKALAQAMSAVRSRSKFIFRQTGDEADSVLPGSSPDGRGIQPRKGQ